MESTEEISYVSQQEAIEIDQMFMGPLGFTVDQLMVSPLIFFFRCYYFLNFSTYP